MYVSAHEKRTS